MRNSSIYSLGFRRKRMGPTDYRKRLKILSSNKLRLVIRRSLKNIQAAIVEYNKKGDIVKVCSHSNNLRKHGWDYNNGNLPAAYLVGFLLGRRAKDAKLDEAVMDIGFHKSVKGSRIYSVLAGSLDAGLKVPHNKDILPVKDRIVGVHIASYADILKKDESLFKKQFGSYSKNNVQASDITKNFEEVKKNIEENSTGK